MTNVIVCDKCGCTIPKVKKKKYKIFFLEKRYSEIETDYYHMSEDFSCHMCLDCFEKFLEFMDTE
jgi:hypothetical protein